MDDIRRVKDPRSDPPSAMRHLLGPCVIVADSMVIVASMMCAFVVRFSSALFDFPTLFPKLEDGISSYFGSFLFGYLVLMVLLVSFGAYETPNLIHSRRAPMPLLRALFWWSCLYLGASLALKFDPPISRVYVVLSLVFSAIGLSAVRAAVLLWVRQRDPYWLRPNLLIVGSPPGATHVAAFLANLIPLPSNVRWIGAPTPGEPPPSGAIDELERVARRDPADLVVIDHHHLPMHRVIETAALCERLYLNYKILPGYSQVFASKFHLENVGPVAVLAPKVLPLDLWRHRAAKRMVDIVGAAVGLVVLSPLAIALGLVIKRSSPGPAIFSQVRYGRRGRAFRMFKLRTMHVGADRLDHEHLSTCPGDPRLLPFGESLRRWNLDEIPQLLNVLKGEMSLVGPRPERVYHADRLSGEIVHYQFRHSVKPGMTGWAQVNGLRGDTDFEERIRHDIHYIENWSLLFDIQIILMTLLGAGSVSPRKARCNPQPEGATCTLVDEQEDGSTAPGN